VAQLAGLRTAYAMMAGFGVLITVLVRLTLRDERPLGSAGPAMLEADALEC
jgi:hypothetical protein